MNKPLYKRLNEERTQGEWEVESTKFSDRVVIATPEIEWAISSFFCEPVSVETEANAAYTCLAVNNLHKLAEVLNKIVDTHQVHIDDDESWVAIKIDLIKEAEQALKSIS